MPCSPGMTKCKLNCAHRAFVMDYRSERLRQETELIEGNRGYATEIADEMRVRREQGTPLMDFREWLKGHKQTPPEDYVMSDEPVQYGNLMAEESLLAVAMFTPKGVDVLRHLDNEEFIASPLNRQIAATIILLEDHGLRATAVEVERALHDLGVKPTEVWDSEFIRGPHIDRSEKGLRGWEKYAGVHENAMYFGTEIRVHSRAQQTDEVLTWGKETMAKMIMSDGPTNSRINWVHRQIAEKLSGLRPPLDVADFSQTPKKRAQLTPKPQFPSVQPSRKVKAHSR